MFFSSLQKTIPNPAFPIDSNVQRAAASRASAGGPEVGTDVKPVTAKGGKKRASKKSKMTATAGEPPADGGGTVKAKARKPRAPRKTKAKAQLGVKADTKPDAFTEEWQMLWDGPSSLFPGPAPWLSIPDEGREGQFGMSSILPANLAHQGVNINVERNSPAPMHPPRPFAYDVGSLIAYQGCEWDPDGFVDMELSALPWLASTHHGTGERASMSASRCTSLTALFRLEEFRRTARTRAAQ